MVLSLLFRSRVEGFLPVRVYEGLLVQTEIYTDLKKIEALLKEAIRSTKKHDLGVQLEILKEALLECQMQIDRVSKGRRR